MKATEKNIKDTTVNNSSVLKSENGSDAKESKGRNINTKDLEKNFGKLAPLARILNKATRVLEEETELVISRASLEELRSIALEKEALLNQHDTQILRLGDLPTLVATMDKKVKTRIRHLYFAFAGALRRNGLRLSAALQASEELLSALSEAALEDSPKSPQTYTSHGKMLESSTVSFHERQEV